MRSAAIIPFTPRQVSIRRRPFRAPAQVFSLAEHRRIVRLRARILTRAFAAATPFSAA